MRTIILLLVMAFMVAVVALLTGGESLRWKYVEAGLINGALPGLAGWLLGLLTQKLYHDWKSRSDARKDAAGSEAH